MSYNVDVLGGTRRIIHPQDVAYGINKVSKINTDISYNSSRIVVSGVEKQYFSSYLEEELRKQVGPAYEVKETYLNPEQAIPNNYGVICFDERQKMKTALLSIRGATPPTQIGYRLLSRNLGKS